MRISRKMMITAALSKVRIWGIVAKRFRTKLVAKMITGIFQFCSFPSEQIELRNLFSFN